MIVVHEVVHVARRRRLHGSSPQGQSVIDVRGGRIIIGFGAVASASGVLAAADE
jgi:hypothetical protein